VSCDNYGFAKEVAVANSPDQKYTDSGEIKKREKELADLLTT
jgi:hypothetical protein